MVQYQWNHWKTDPEYTEFLNNIIEETRNVDAPMNAQRMAREFKEKSGTTQTVKLLKNRIYKLRSYICSFDHIETMTKVKIMFAISAPVNPEFLKELEKDAFVVIDEKKRITYYNANDGSLELSGDHSSSLKDRTKQLEFKKSIRSWIIDYFENKHDSKSVPENNEEKEMWNLMECIAEKCENVDTPLNIARLVKDFKNHFGISKQIRSIEKRVRGYCREIQTLEFLDTPSKVKQLFGLSATVDPDYLKKLRKDALVNVDEKNRISHYKANDGSLELSGDHSMSAKVKLAMREVESKRNYRSMIIGYFENKNKADAVAMNKEEEETWNFIEFITERCENGNSPLSIRQLTKDFNNRFGKARSFHCIYNRVKSYCREIQTMEFLDTHSKVKQLFCLSATLNSNFLTELRKNAVVEVDDLNRIAKYTANNGRLTLHGDHNSSAKIKLGRTERKKKRNTVKGYCNFEDDDDDESENEIVHSEDDSDEYSDGGFDIEDDNNHLDESENLIEPSNEVHDYHHENSGRINSPTDMSIDDNFDFDPPTGKESEVIKIREDDGRKRKNSFPTAPTSGKKLNKSTTGVSSSNWTGSFSNNSMRSNKLDDYDTKYSINDQVKSEPVFGSMQEDLNEIEENEDFQQVLKSPQALGEHDQIDEVPIKTGVEKPIELKPETSHNSKIKFFEAMHSLIACLDTPSLSWIQSKVQQKIQELGESDEVILNNEIVLIIELLIYRMTNHFVENLSENVESVNLSNFLIYLKAAVLNSKMSGMEGLVKNISELIEELQNKRVPMEKVANALLATLDIDGV